MSKIVSVVIGSSGLTQRSPYALKCTILPFRAMSTTQPGIFFCLSPSDTTASIAASRPASMPTEEGGDSRRYKDGLVPIVAEQTKNVIHSIFDSRVPLYEVRLYGWRHVGAKAAIP